MCYLPPATRGATSKAATFLPTVSFAHKIHFFVKDQFANTIPVFYTLDNTAYEFSANVFLMPMHFQRKFNVQLLGKQNKSVFWYSQFPDHCVSDAKNFCRNPGGDKEHPWCYYGERQGEWEYCDIPYCSQYKYIFS